MVGARREDGRQRFRIYLNQEEYEALKSQGFEIVDPREAAKKRRAERKAKKAASGEAGVSEEAPQAEVTLDEADDPFADFG